MVASALSISGIPGVAAWTISPPVHAHMTPNAPNKSFLRMFAPPNGRGLPDAQPALPQVQGGWSTRTVRARSAGAVGGAGREVGDRREVWEPQRGVQVAELACRAGGAQRELDVGDQIVVVGRRHSVIGLLEVGADPTASR